MGYELSAENGLQLVITAGFADSVITLQTGSEIIYKCLSYYAPESEGALRWDDPSIGIKWPVQADATLNAKDALVPTLPDHDSLFHVEG